MSVKFLPHCRRLIIAAVIIPVIVSLGCYPSSQGRSESALRAAVQKNPADAEARIELAALLRKRNAPFDAVLTLQDGLKLDPTNTSLLKSLGETYYDWGQQTNGTKKFEMAAQYLQQIADMGVADAETFKSLGYAQFQARHYENAIQSFLNATRLKPDDAYSLRGLGSAYKETGKYEKALPPLEAAAKLSPNNYVILRPLADAQRLVGDYAAAVASLKKAIELSPPQQRSELQEHVKFTEGLLSKQRDWYAYSCHHQFADRHAKQGRPDRAAAEYKAALEVLPEGGYQFAGWCNLRIAQFYSHVYQFETSVEYLRRAIEAYTKAKSARDLAFVYQHLGGGYHKFAGRDKARRKELLEKALKATELQEQCAREAGDTHMATHALADKATVIAELFAVDDPRVKECRKEMAQYIPESGPITDCAVASVVQAEAWLRARAKDYDGAKKLYEMVASYFVASKDVRDMDSAPHVYNMLGYISAQQKDLDTAIMYGEKAVAKLCEMRSMVGVDAYRRTVASGTWRWVFSTGLVKAALVKGDKPRAFNYAEQYKGRALMDLLGSKGNDTKRRGLEKKTAQRAVVLARVQGLERQALQTGQRGAADSVRGLERTLSIEKTSYDRLAEDVSTAEREVKNFEDVDSLKVEQLQPLTDGLTIVSYVVGDWGTCATVLREGSVEGVAIEGASEEKLRGLIDDFRKEVGLKSGIARDLAIEVEPGKEAPPEKVKKGASEELYKLLIEPVLPYIKTKLVIISPDSVLNYLPFEALHKDGRYLVEEYAIAYAPSASVLKICMDRNRNRREKVLAFGNPNLKNPAFRLVHAEDEVNSLKGLFPQVDVYTGDKATERVLQEHGSEYDILHFACHGELNMDEPMLTSLRLAPDNENDGYLHAGEVFDYDLSASLVVLSACNSALGELTSGNELMGLTRSFLYAGVPSIVASLWTVDDRSTAYLMQEFYKNLGTMTKADALREAKLATMKKYPSPFHWAAFCLQGDYR